MNDPTIRRRFQYYDPDENSNKSWEIQWWESSGFTKTLWGRVGDKQNETEYPFKTKGWVNGKIREKEKKGYNEVGLHQVVVSGGGQVVQTGDPQVDAFVSFVFTEAGENIQTKLAVSVDSLSIAQIQKGRQILSTVQDLIQKGDRYAVTGAAKEYFNTIPTILPRRIDKDSVTRWLVDTLADKEEDLKQFEAGLATARATQSGASQTTSLGAEIRPIPSSNPVYEQILDYVRRTAPGYEKRISRIFAVNIPSERAAWDTETIGKSYINKLWHGTKSYNVRHILRTGLIIPKIAANGSRFGRGIYFADQARRSINYAGSNRSQAKVLFMTEVALGRQKKLTGDDSRLTAAPDGFDSVWGVQSYSGMDEFIVYRSSQQTIRAILVLDM